MGSPMLAGGLGGSAMAMALIAAGPATMGTTTIVGMSLMAASAAAAAESSRQAGMLQAKIARQNAAAAYATAADAAQRGVLAEEAVRRKTAKLSGFQRVAVAASGADVGSGSALQLYEDTAMLGELDALTARVNGAREAWGYKTRGTQFGAEAVAAKSGGENQAVGSLLQGGAQIYGQGSSLNLWA